MKKLFITLLSIYFLIVSLVSQAQIYKWVDEEGNVHFGDESSRDANAKDISQDLPKLNMTKGSDTGYVPSGESVSARKQRLREEKEEKQAALEPACNKAKKELRILSGPVYFTNDDGSEYTVSESERAELEKELRAEIKRYCG